MDLAAIGLTKITPRFIAGLLFCMHTLIFSADVPADYENAMAVAKQVVTDFPNHPQSFILMGKVHQALSEWDEAIANYQKSFELNPKNSDTAILCAQVYEKKYEYENAIVWYQKAIGDESPQDGLYEKTGLNYVQLNQMDEAKKAFEQELELHPNNASTHYYLAQRMLEAGELEKATEHAQRCTELDERYPEPLYLLAQIARQQNDMQKAQDYLTLFRDKKKKESEYVNETENDVSSPNQLESQVNAFAGAVYLQQGDHKKAEEFLRQAITLDPKQEDARVNLIPVYTQTKNITKLEYTLRELHTLLPNKVSYMTQLGDVLNAKQQWDEALPLVEKAYQLEQTLQTKKSLAHVLITSQTDPVRALQFMQEVVAVEPLAINYDLLSRAYYVTRNLPQCIEAMQMASQLDPANPTYRQRLQKLQALKQ
jgi:tetratricopeptide (TPR) repeat protein